MTLALQDTLWDILESEAYLRFFINDAEKPAFLLLHKWNPISCGGFELYMNHVTCLGKFKSEKKALARLDEAISNAKIPIRVHIQKKKGFVGFGKKKLYATVDPTKPKEVKM